MKILFLPTISGAIYFNPNQEKVTLDAQVLETQGLLSQLALHAGIHVEIPPYPVRLADYYNALKEYDAADPGNMFHESIAIDGMNVAKTLMGWRDNLCMTGWSGQTGISARFDALSKIETYYKGRETGLPILLRKVEECVAKMAEGKLSVPGSYKELEIEVACEKQLLPDYLLPIFDRLEKKAKKVVYGTVDKTANPKQMEIVEFGDQYKAEAWLSQQEDNAYDVWINTDNKRLDNWLHMTGKPVAGSDMLHSNPQVTQMFLLAIQLFGRPLNINTLLQYLYLPERPLPWLLATRLASTLVREGGFCSDKVVKCINEYLDREFKDDANSCELSSEERRKQYTTYLPFDLRDENASELSTKSDDVDLKKLKVFLKEIKDYVSSRAIRIAAKMAYDKRVEQLGEVSALIDALLIMLEGEGKTISFDVLQKWALSLYGPSNYGHYDAQVGSRLVVDGPSNVITKARNVIWCDFYGDVKPVLTTDFLSPREIKVMQSMDLRLWKQDAEKAYNNFVLAMPLHQTEEKLTFVVCEKRGATLIPTHPLRLQLPADIAVIDGDELFAKLPAIGVQRVDNHREEDAKEITFDAVNHPVTWREQESFSALEKLLQNPFDYFMNYILGFTDKGPTEIKLSQTNGNVAHETIETLFTAERGEKGLKAYVIEEFDAAFEQALARKGALLLLPEHHLDCDRLRHQLRRCVIRLAEIVEVNRLTVVICEQEENQELGFEGGIIMTGYIDMVLKDAEGKDVVIDLKWTTKKDKHATLIKENRDAQLALYSAMLQQHADHPTAVRTAFFVMPEGNIVSADNFEDCNYRPIIRKTQADVIETLRKGYSARRNEINAGKIETSDLVHLAEIDYANNEGVFPLETDGKVKNPKKAENKYSDYQCFTK